MRRMAMRLRLPALGAVFSLLLGSGVVALIRDDAVSRENLVESLTAAHDLRAVIVRPVSAPCPTRDSDYRTEPISAVLVLRGRAALSPSDTYMSEPLAVCVRNFGASAGTLSVGFTNILSLETACSPGEREAGDASCGPEGSGTSSWGELGHAAEIAISGLPECGPTSGSFSEFTSGPRPLVERFATGAVCKFTVGARYKASDEMVMRRAQTDNLRWDIGFVLEDRQPPPDGV